MSEPQTLKTELIQTLDHVGRVFTKLLDNSGTNKALTFPDAHKLSEGLCLTVWAQWEEFTRELLVTELASIKKSALNREIKNYKKKGGPLRLAELVVNHPDHPEKFIEWSSYNVIQKRAGTLLGPGNRFESHPLARAGDLEHLKRIRNGIAHKSDKAWESFRSLVKQPPFSLLPTQLKGLTVGRFLYAHQWNGQRVLQEAINVVRDCVVTLVP